MPLDFSADFSFHASPKGDISIKQGGSKTGVRIKQLDPESPITKQKIESGTAMFIQLAKSKEQVPVEVKDLKNAVKKLSPNASPESRATRNNLSSSSDVPGLLAGSNALAVDWDQRTGDQKPLPQRKG